MNTEQTEEPNPVEGAEPVMEQGAEPEPATVSLEDELTKYRDAALRARADLDNYRKRVVREKEDSIRYANASLFDSLLPILDNFELGMSAAKSAPEAAGIVQGLEMVRKQMEEFLRSNGVESLDATGQPFDPNLHEAVAHEPSDEVAEGVVISQLRKGFKLRDRLLRPATVVVSKGPATE